MWAHLHGSALWVSVLADKDRPNVFCNGSSFFKCFSKNFVVLTLNIYGKLRTHTNKHKVSLNAIITNSAQKKNVTHGNLSCNASDTHQNTDSQACTLTHTSRQHDEQDWRFFKLIFTVFLRLRLEMSALYLRICVRAVCLCTQPCMRITCVCVLWNIRPSGDHKTHPL